MTKNITICLHPSIIKASRIIWKAHQYRLFALPSYTFTSSPMVNLSSSLNGNDYANTSRPMLCCVLSLWIHSFGPSPSALLSVCGSLDEFIWAVLSWLRSFTTGMDRLCWVYSSWLDLVLREDDSFITPFILCLHKWGLHTVTQSDLFHWPSSHVHNVFSASWDRKSNTCKTPA